MLYIASGDDHSMASGVTLAAQDTTNLLGKILRIDVDRDDFPADFAKNYGIPAGNPFVGRDGADEIFAYGLRNPWRPSFDTATGDLYIGDVGASLREEIDVIPAGASGFNFGWPFKEGFAVRTSDPGGLTNPVLDYDRVTPLYRGFAVTGGYVYHGPGGGQGLYVFSDYVSGALWTTRVSGGQATDFLNRNSQLTVVGGDLDQITSFGVDGRGRLYVVGQDGDIHRLDFGDAAGDGMDYLRGDDGNDTILGGIGFDDINGNMGDDTAAGGLGDDWVVGGKDQDWLAGDTGNDIVFGNLGDDTLDGGAGRRPGPWRPGERRHAGRRRGRLHVGRSRRRHRHRRDGRRHLQQLRRSRDRPRHRLQPRRRRPRPPRTRQHLDRPARSAPTPSSTSPAAGRSSSSA